MKEIEGYPGYFITEDGRVWSDKRNRLLNIRVSKGGYSEVMLYNNGQCTSFKVHRLVATAFVKNPDPENYNIVNHKDGNKLHNHYTNLEWCTHSINLRSFRSIQINCKTGILGVYLEINGQCKYYFAKWRDFEGKECKKSFSVIKHGEDEAKRLAIEYRKKMEQEYYFKQDAQ